MEPYEEDWVWDEMNNFTDGQRSDWAGERERIGSFCKSSRQTCWVAEAGVPIPSSSITAMASVLTGPVSYLSDNAGRGHTNLIGRRLAPVLNLRFKWEA